MPTTGSAAAWLRADQTGVLILVHLQPGARRTGIAGEFNGRLKIAVAAPPLEDRANEALREWLARRLAVAGRNIDIVSGRHSRDKALHVDGIDVEYAWRQLAQEMGSVDA